MELSLTKKKRTSWACEFWKRHSAELPQLAAGHCPRFSVITLSVRSRRWFSWNVPPHLPGPVAAECHVCFLLFVSPRRNVGEKLQRCCARRCLCHHLGFHRKRERWVAGSLSKCLWAPPHFFQTFSAQVERRQLLTCSRHSKWPLEIIRETGGLGIQHTFSSWTGARKSRQPLFLWFGQFYPPPQKKVTWHSSL